MKIGLEATDEMVEAAALVIQDSCDIQNAESAARIVRDVWGRMIENAPLEWSERRSHPS
jgi:hypothetical protein